MIEAACYVLFIYEGWELYNGIPGIVFGQEAIQRTNSHFSITSTNDFCILHRPLH